MDAKENFCKRLKEVRLSKKLTQAEVCNALKIPNRQYLSRWEKGIQEPNINTLYLLASYYGCSLDYLFGLSDVRERR